MKKVQLDKETRYKSLSWKDQNRLRSYVLDRDPDLIELIEQYIEKVKNSVSNLISKYIMDPEITELFSKCPEIFITTGGVTISAKSLGMVDENDDIIIDGAPVPGMIGLNDLNVPLNIFKEKRTRYYNCPDVGKDLIDSVPDGELQPIKDLVWEIIQLRAKQVSPLYKDGKDIFSGKIIETYGDLYKYNQDWYKYIQEKNGFKVVEIDVDEEEPGVDVSKVRKTNTELNKILLENLKSILNL